MKTTLEEMRADMLKMALCDLLLYRTEKETGLYERQTEKWGKVLFLMKERYGFSLKSTVGVMPISQEKSEADKVKAVIDAVPDEKVTSLYAAGRLLGSPLLALAAYSHLISPEDAYDYSIIDDIWQNDISGYDKEEVVRRENVKKDFLVLVKDW